MNYAELVRDNAYFVDKTRFIAKLEEIHNPVFLVRRLGNLFCSMLHYYYDRAQEKRFEELFCHTWIGKNPTTRHNQFIVFKGDFSEIGVHQQITESDKNRVFIRKANRPYGKRGVYGSRIRLMIRLLNSV